MSVFRAFALAAALFIVAQAEASVQLTQVATGVSSLVGIEHAGDGSGRLFLVRQTGQIHIYDGTSVLSAAFLDISGLVQTGGERGLLGLAFHPDYETNGFFFVNYVRSPNVTVVARYQVSGNPNIANAGSRTILLEQSHPFENHKGGQIRFGPDGFLYVAIGDGGSGGDPQNNGQRLDTLLGKILRIDVNIGPPYVPPGNPFIGMPGAREEIWSYGLRNPWRFAFDRQTGEMLIADVGQGLWEEINVEPAGTGGRNYGWRRMEGTHCYTPSTNCNTGSLVLPIIEYPHALGCSVTGGFRNRGTTLPGYVGTYFFGDYCSGRIWGATPNGDGSWSASQLLASNVSLSTFGEDEAGNLYVGHIGGTVYRLVTAAASLPRLTVTKSGNGTAVLIESSPAAIYCPTICAEEGTGGTLTLSVTPATGTTFWGWSGDADCSDGVVTLTESRTCVAHLTATGFTDATLVSTVNVIKAIHVTELRARIDAQRVRYGLTTMAWFDPQLAVGSTPVRALHVTQMRTALDAAYDAAKRTVPIYTDPSLGAGTSIRAIHITDLRLAVVALEGN